MNEFSLIVTWTPLRKKRKVGLLAPHQLTNLLNSLAIVSHPKPLIKDLPVGKPVYCMEPMPGRKERYILGINEGLYVADLQNAKLDQTIIVADKTIKEIRSIKFYKDYIITLSDENEGVKFFKEGRFLFSLKDYRILSTKGPHSKTHCQNVEIVKGHLIYIADQDMKLVSLNLEKLLHEFHERGKVTDKPRVIDSDTIDFCCPSSPWKIYQLKMTKEICLNGKPICRLASFGSEEETLQCMDMLDNLIAVVSTQPQGCFNTVELFSSHGKALDVADDPNEDEKVHTDYLNQAKHVKMFAVGKALFLVYSRMTNHLVMYAVCRNKLHPVGLKLKSHESTANSSIYGFMPSNIRQEKQTTHCTFDLIVFGFSTLAAVSLSFKL